MEKRLIWADSLKGFLIVLVVLGHAIQHTISNACFENHLWNFIYSFHMPAFMAVSGYLAYRGSAQVGGGIWKDVIWRRFRQLIIPFVLWTFILLLVGGKLNWSDMKVYLFYPDKGLWFLWVLFFINIIFVTGSLIAKSINVKQVFVEFAICGMLVCTMVFFELRILGFQFIAYYFLFYTLGYYLHKYQDRIVTSKWYVLLPLFFVWLVLAWFWQMHNLPCFMMSIPLPPAIMQYLYRFATAAIAIYILLAISPHTLGSNKNWNKPFVNLGKVSLGIYTVHFIILGTIVEYYKGLNMTDWMTILSSFITGVIISWFIVWLLSKWRITSCWLLGKI